MRCRAGREGARPRRALQGARSRYRKQEHGPAGSGQSPVARDLRLLYTVRTVTNHLVRSGTLCEHICRAITETADSERSEDLEATLLEMARAARSVFGEGLDIFRHRDIERARDLQAKDDRVDLLYSDVLNLIVNPFDVNGGAPE